MTSDILSTEEILCLAHTCDHMLFGAGRRMRRKVKGMTVLHGQEGEGKERGGGHVYNSST